ncbi:Uma2 family endonuclease [Spirulina major]|uniref:Uma2 family endonuclease n=1 Tax=Spirulina major TaxID=270636 RepID=UPI000933C86E|nr:Uma2 family endonuclease [Spirulina major]
MVSPPGTASTLTLADFLAQPETKPAREFIEGAIAPKPTPQGKHSIIQGELVTAINAVVKQPKIARAFPELRCTFAGRSIVPDVAVLEWRNIPRDDNGEIANQFLTVPDWIIEILSPSQSHTQVVKKILGCLKVGCQMGWLIDPSERTIFIYQPKQETDVFDSSNDEILTVPEFARGFELTVQGLFDWLM